MSAKTTLVLLAVLILVAGGVYYLEFRKPAGPAAPVTSTSLLDLTASAITGISVRDVVSGTQVSVTRDVSGTWWIADQNNAADPAALGQSVARVASIYVQRVITPTGGVDEYGLTKPVMNVDITSVAGASSFSVGDMTPSKGAYYVQKPGDPHVYLIDTGVVDDLRKLAGSPPVAVPPTPEFVAPKPAAP